MAISSLSDLVQSSPFIALQPPLQWFPFLELDPDWFEHKVEFSFLLLSSLFASSLFLPVCASLPWWFPGGCRCASSLFCASLPGVRALERLGSSCLDPRDDTGGDGWGRLSLTSPLSLIFSSITEIYTNTQMQKHICKKYTKSKTQKMTPSITAPLVDIIDSPVQNSWTSGPFGSSWLG